MMGGHVNWINVYLCVTGSGYLPNCSYNLCEFTFIWSQKYLHETMKMKMKTGRILLLLVCVNFFIFGVVNNLCLTFYVFFFVLAIIIIPTFCFFLELYHMDCLECRLLVRPRALQILKVIAVILGNGKGIFSLKFPILSMR